MKVLFLDDNISLLQQTIQYLEEEQFEVLVATDSKEVFAAFNTAIPPEVCFFDVNLKHTEQHINGLDIAEKIMELFPNSIIIMFTNWSDHDEYYIRAKALNLDFVDRKLLGNKAWILDKISNITPPKLNLIQENDGRIVFYDGTNLTYYCIKNTDILSITTTRIVPSSMKPYSGTKIQLYGGRQIDFKVTISKVIDNFRNLKIDISHLKEISSNCYISLSHIHTIVGANTVLMDSNIEVTVSGADKNRILEFFKKVVQNDQAKSDKT